MNEEILKELGLSKNEVKVYLALLRLGTASVGELTKNSSVHRRNVYDVLEKLTQKGLIGFVTKEKTKTFQITNLEMLRERITNEKRKIFSLEKKLNSMIPQLLSIKKSKEPCDVSIYRGPESRKIVFEDILSTGKENHVLGAHTPSKMMRRFLINWHRKRTKKGIVDKLIYGKREPYAKMISRLSLTEVRYMPFEMDSKTAINIYGAKVAIFVWTDGYPTTIHINNKKVADDFRKYFDFLWKISKE